MRIDQLSLDEEIRLFFEYMQPQLAVWEKHLQSLKRGELEKLRILDKIDRAIEFDSRGEITEMMRLHRERFATAMDAVIEHNTKPKTADEMQAAAIQAVYSAFVIGLCVEKPEDIFRDVIEKGITPEIEPALKAARSKSNNQKSVAASKIKMIDRENELADICRRIPGHSSMKNKPLAEIVHAVAGHAVPFERSTTERKIAKLKREGRI